MTLIGVSWIDSESDNTSGFNIITYVQIFRLYCLQFKLNLECILLWPPVNCGLHSFFPLFVLYKSKRRQCAVYLSHCWHERTADTFKWFCWGWLALLSLLLIKCIIICLYPFCKWTIRLNHTPVTYLMLSG